MASASLFTTFLILSATLALLTPSSAYNVLYSSETLTGGQSLTEGSYTFTTQTNCNLVLYDGNKVIWKTGTTNLATNCYLTLQSDGNLVIYSGSKVIWATGTNTSKGNFALILQRDRNLVIYGNAIWTSKTNVA